MKFDHNQWIPKVGVIDSDEVERIATGEWQATKEAAWQEAERMAECYGATAAWFGVLPGRDILRRTTGVTRQGETPE